jgi:alpha-glucosidase (family GH31 glycosyl hydrolase)
VEWGAFSPVFRTHATNDPGIERRIWMYPEANFKAMRKALQERYALLPYIYTMARYAYDSSISIVHPMYYEYPDMDKAYHMEGQYFFGNNMIAAPISKSMKGKDAVSQTIWLPAGHWYDFRNNNLLDGGKNAQLNYALDEVPVFIKAGSIIPMQTPKLRITGSVLDTLILTVYPECNELHASHCNRRADFNLYEDQGNNEDYRKNICSFTQFRYREGKDGWTVEILPDGKIYPGQVTERSYEIRIVDSEKPKQVMMNGKSLDWSYDDKSRVTIIKTPKEKISAALIEIR